MLDNDHRVGDKPPDQYIIMFICPVLSFLFGPARVIFVGLLVSIITFSLLYAGIESYKTEALTSSQECCAAWNCKSWSELWTHFQITLTALCYAFHFLYHFIFSLCSQHLNFLKYGHLWKTKDGNRLSLEISQVSEINIIYSILFYLWEHFAFSHV